MVTAFAGLVGEHHGPTTDVHGVLTPESSDPMTEYPAIMSRAAHGRMCLRMGGLTA